MNNVRRYAIAVIESKLGEARTAADFYGRNGSHDDWEFIELHLIAAQSLTKAFYTNGLIQIGEYQTLMADIERMTNNYSITII